MKLSTAYIVAGLFTLHTLFASFAPLSAQTADQFSGIIASADGYPIEMATITIEGEITPLQSDQKGGFSFAIKDKRLVNITIEALGYASQSWKIDLRKERKKTFVLKESHTTLNELIVDGNKKRDLSMKSAQSITQVDQLYIEQNFAGSLMQSLEKIPGVKAMSIGSGQSKPAIRGLGFNRMIVTENGIKHEGQQWGEDHGLEIDQFAVDNLEVIKGPGSLIYGSDAIAGVINLRDNYIPSKPIEGKASVFARSNNQSLGVHAQISGRKNKFAYKANLTLIDYADYKVPTDSIQYYSYYIKLKDRQLRNTAGKEQNFGLMAGYFADNITSNFTLTNVYAKSGFFANAHGLEVRLSDIDYDKSARDIDLPFHSVNHLKLINNTTWRLSHVSLEGNFAYQNNLRKEFAEAVSHGYMPIPPSTLERKFDKNTFSAQIGAKMLLQNQHSLSAGISAEHQNNKRAGWGFIVPDFRTTAFGAYVYDRFHVSENLILSAGIRADRIETDIDSYHDWYKTPTQNGDSIYKERAADLHRNFSSVTWSAGINYKHQQWTFKANVGKSFRAPIPKELGADGVNYHIFRYEKGDPNLSPEVSYQLDTEVSLQGSIFEVQVSPFVNYFPNYIYLNPTSGYNEGLQVYNYTQSKVLRYGFEAEATLHLSANFNFNLMGEYLYAEQLSGAKKGYTLPFSPPWTVTPELKYMPRNKWLGETGFLSVNYKITGSQNEIVPPEKATDGSQTLNMSAAAFYTWQGHAIKVSLQGQNLLNKKYYDHTSFYRLIDVPEPGRNFAILLGIDF